MSRIADEAIAAALAVVEAPAGPGVMQPLALARARTGRRPPPAPPVKLSQRGRTGTAPGYNASLHPRGAHGMFTQSNRPKQQSMHQQAQKAIGSKAVSDERKTQAAARRQTAEKKAAEALAASRKKGGGSSRSSSSSSGTGGTAAPATGKERATLIAAEKAAHDAGNQRLAEQLRAQINGTSSSSRSSRSSKSKAASAHERRERSLEKAEAAIEKASEPGAVQGKLNLSESLSPGKGMGKNEIPSPAVAQVQNKLQALGYNLGSAGIDGKLGTATGTALKVLQKEYGLKPDGVVGPQTLQLLETLTERSQKWAKHGIIAAEVLPGESIGAAVRAVLSAGGA